MTVFSLWFVDFAQQEQNVTQAAEQMPPKSCCQW